MNPKLANLLTELSAVERLQLDQRCDAFEDALRSRRDVSIEEILATIDNPSVRRAVVAECIGLELYHGRSNRQTQSSYESRFSDCSDAIKVAFAENAALFAPQTELGHYQIEECLGQGGSGIVYRATDQKLARIVALKILPASLSEDRQRIERFHSEAKILASLNHPHIATLYGFEEIEGLPVCIMEYVPGKTLSQEIDRSGPLNVELVERLFRQIAGAMEYAHARGVVHRDLKPSNIQVAPTEEAKVLDFGLAMSGSKTLAEADAARNESRALAGTLPYMSPEQLRDRAVDKRTDVWAFGCCLFEALTCSRPFRGETLSQIVASIMDDSPDWELLPKETPPEMRLVLRRSLSKDPHERLRDIGDAWLSKHQLDDLRALSLCDSTGVQDGAAGRRLSRWQTAARALPWLLLAASIIVFATNRRAPTNPGPANVYVEEIALPDGQHLAIDKYGPLGRGRRSIAISGDGQNLAYIAVDTLIDARPRIYCKRLGTSAAATSIAGTEGAYDIFFSPDDRSLAFVSEGRLKTTDLEGRTVTELCEVTFPIGGVWSDDEDIYVGDHFGDRLIAVHSSGREAPVMRTQWRDRGFRWLEALSGDHGLLFTRPHAGLKYLNLSSGEEKTVLESNSQIRSQLVDGRLAMTIDGHLHAAQFDSERIALISDTVSVLDGMRTGTAGNDQYAVSRTGTLAYVPGKPGQRSRLVRVRRTQIDAASTSESFRVKAELLEFDEERLGNFELSPDGNSMAIEIEGSGTTNIWRYDLPTTTRTQLTHKGNNRHPVWSPDGKQIAFSSDRNGSMRLFVKSSAHESEAAVPLTPPSPRTQYAYGWAPNKEVAFREESESGHTLWVIEPNLNATPSNRRLENITPMNEITTTAQVQFSPNGKWVAHTRFHVGDQATIRLQRYPVTDEHWNISAEHIGEELRWSTEGDRIYFRSGTHWMAVDFAESDSGAPVLTEPRPLFEGNFVNVTGYSYDITPNGDFILLESLQEQTPTRMVVIHNWLQSLPLR